MKLSLDVSDFRFTGDGKVHLKDRPTKIEDLYEGKSGYRDLLAELTEGINERQRMMYAHNRYSMLLIFQATDAAGKDGTIRNVFSGVNVHGVVVHAFKAPSDNELEHDFLWRTTLRLPQRGKIGIFNRSYYEEVLVVRVNPQILLAQNLPEELTKDPDEVWKGRYESIRDFEKHMWRNGTRVVKFFLNLGYEEQRERFLARIDKPHKNWKFNDADVAKRAYWKDYRRAYEDAINATAAEHAPWYIVPADDKKNMRLIVARIVLSEMGKLDMGYPEVSDAHQKELQDFRDRLVDD